MDKAKTTHKLITATYNMYDISGGKNVLIESTPQENPMSIITGFGMTPLPALEDALVKSAENESFEVILTPEKAFGERVDGAIVDIGKDAFYVDGRFDSSIVRQGAVIPLRNEDGQVFSAQVLEVGDENVRVDLNHPLAGLTLLFSGRIMASHDATDEEIMAFTSHKSCACHGGCHDGKCSSECSDGGCGGGCGHCAS